MTLSDVLALGSATPSIVLFCTRHPSVTTIRSRFERAQWPAGYRVCAVDVTDDPEVTRWFNLNELPAMAVVQDGMILALEYECSDEACDRLLRVAGAQRRRFDDI